MHRRTWLLLQSLWVAVVCRFVIAYARVLDHPTLMPKALSLPRPATTTAASIPLCSPNPLVQQTLVKLVSLGCPPLPIAPLGEPAASPLLAAPTVSPWLSGKNPSFLGRDGSPYLVQHGEFHDRLPTFAQLKVFFAHPDVGIATVGGHQGIIWLDFDAKCYPSQADCDSDVQQVLERLLAHTGLPLSALWLEQTGGGGYRLPLRPRRLPTFTKFATTPEGRSVGEVLGQGQCAVLAPTRHPNGQLYRVLQSGLPVPVESLATIGLYPVTPPPVTPAHRVPDRSNRPHFRLRGSQCPDLRQLAPFLDGYREGRVWGSARCPGTAGHPYPQSYTSLSVHLGTGRFHLFCECNRSAVYWAALVLAQQRGFVPS